MRTSFRQLIFFNALLDVPITYPKCRDEIAIMVIQWHWKKISEHIRKLPISKNRTTNYSKEFLWSLATELSRFDCSLFCVNKVKNSNFQYFRANNSGVTELTMELIQYLVPINTSCKFGPDWLRNVVSFVLTRKKLKEAGRRINRYDISLWPVELIKTNCYFWTSCNKPSYVLLTKNLILEIFLSELVGLPTVFLLYYF